MKNLIFFKNKKPKYKLDSCKYSNRFYFYKNVGFRFYPIWRQINFSLAEEEFFTRESHEANENFAIQVDGLGNVWLNPKKLNADYLDFTPTAHKFILWYDKFGKFQKQYKHIDI